MKLIVFKNEDGTVGIVNPAPEMFDPTSRTRLNLPQLIDASYDEVMAFVIQRSVPDGKPYRIIDESQIPTDRVFRNAWTDDLPTDTVDIDIDKAKEIKKGTLRDLRKPLLADLDVAYMRADEQDDEQAKLEIRAKKQELRDVTSLDLPDDIAELKEFLPDILKGE